MSATSERCRMISQAMDHNLAVALHEIGFIGRIVVEPRNQRFSFDKGVRNLFPSLHAVKQGQAPLAELDRRIDAKDLSFIHNLLGKPVNKSGRLIMEYALTDDAGQRHVIQSHCKAIQVDEAGRANQLLSVLIDVTPLRSDCDPVLAVAGSEGTQRAAAIVDDLMTKASLEGDTPLDWALEDDPTSDAGELLTMQDVAEHLQVPYRTLRFFEDRGLVKPRHTADDRLFTRAQLDELTFSARMRRIGFTIADIRTMLEGSKDQAHPRIDPASAQAQRKLLEQQIESLREATRMLDAETGHRAR